MPSYRVKWEIDIEADNAQSAAIEALLIQRNIDSIATVFEVSNDHTVKETIDLRFLSGMTLSRD